MDDRKSTFDETSMLNRVLLIHRSLTFTLNLLWLYLKIRISIKLAMRNLISIQGRQRKILAH